MLQKQYIVIFIGESPVTSFLEDKDLWDTDPEEECYGYYKVIIDGWRVIRQNLFTLDTGTHCLCDYIKLSMKVFEECNRFEPTVILAESNLSCWQKCFNRVYVLNEPCREWEALIKGCIRESYPRKG